MIDRCRRLFTLSPRRLVLALVLLLLLGMLGIAAFRVHRHISVENHLRAADQAMARYEFTEAREQLAACLQVRPKDAALHLRMARAVRLAGRFEEAAHHLEMHHQLAGNTTAAALEGLLLRAQSGDLAGVEGILMERVQADPNSDEAAEILSALAQGWLRVYHLDAAMYCLNELLKRRPDDPVALLQRGSLWEQLPDQARAEADYRRAVEVQPDYVDARCRLGEFLFKNSRVAEALRHFEHARQRSRNHHPRTLLGLARCHEQMGHPDRNLQMLDELLERYPHDPDALVERGKLALANESPAAAEDWLRRAVAEDPFNPQSNYLLAQALRRQDKFEEAKKYAAAQERIKRNSTRLEAALARVKKSLTDPEPRREVGLLCLDNGQEAEGERWLLSALRIAPNHAATRTALADYYQRTGKTDLAARYRSAEK